MPIKRRSEYELRDNPMPKGLYCDTCIFGNVDCKKFKLDASLQHPVRPCKPRHNVALVHILTDQVVDPKEVFNAYKKT